MHMCTHMNMCMQQMCIHACICKCACMHTRMHACMHAYICAFMHMCRNCMHAHVHKLHVCTCMHANVYADTRMHMHACFSCTRGVICIASLTVSSRMLPGRLINVSAASKCPCCGGRASESTLSRLGLCASRGRLLEHSESSSESRRVSVQSAASLGVCRCSQQHL